LEHGDSPCSGYVSWGEKTKVAGEGGLLMPEAVVEKTTTLWRDKLIIGLRGLQIITIGFAVTGVIWSTSDLLISTVLVGVPVTPLSVLFTLYGTAGTFIIEGVIRVLERKLGKANFLGEREGDG